MRVQTEEFKQAHGKAPCGTGLWMFSAGRNGAWTDIEVNGSFTEARAEAVREAKSLGCDQLVVNP
jgi:hypothetical protein